MAEMTFTIAGGPGIEVHVEEIEGDLCFTVSVLGEGGLTADIRGIFFDLAGVTLPEGLALTSSDGSVTEFRAIEGGVINLGAGANMNGAADPFDVGVEIGTAGIGRDDWQATSFVLSADEALSLDFLASQVFGVRLTSVGEEGGARTGGLKLVGTMPGAPDTNEPPVAVDDAAATNEDTAITIDVLKNDSDPDADALAVTWVQATSDLGAAVSLDANGRIVYDPTGSAKLGALNTGDEPLPDSFTYIVTDANGATSTANVTVTVAGVTDAPVDGFDGKRLAYTYDVLGEASYRASVTVSGDIEVPYLQGDTFALGSVDITNTQVIVDLAAGSAEFLDFGGFNGIRIRDAFDEVQPIKAVSINALSTIDALVGFNALDDLSWTDDSISVDFAGVSYVAATGPHLILDVVFG